MENLSYVKINDTEFKPARDQRKRETERQRQRERERERQTDRETERDRQTERKTKLIARSSDQRGWSKHKTDDLINLISNNHSFEIY